MTIVRFALLFMIAASAALAEESSVLVTAAMPHQGRLPDTVTAYGTAGPALDSSMTVSLQSQGRVLRFDVTPGESIKTGQPLLQFGVSEAALGSYKQAETALKTATVDKARITQLLRQQLATKDQLTQADKVIADAQTALQTLKKSGADEAETTIKAPFDGVVATIPVAQGDTLAAGAPMMTLIRADGLVVSVGIEPAQRFRVKRGEPVTLQPLTSGDAVASGTLARIDGLLNPKTHLVDADVATSAPLLPGAAFEANIIVGHFDGIVVPRDTVLTDGNGAYFFQVVEGKAHRVAVTIIGATRDESVVTGAIDLTKPIVLQGNYQLVDGAAVRFDDSENSGTESAIRNQP